MFDLKKLPEILKRDLNTPALIIAAGRLGITFVRDAYLLMAGTITQREFRVRTGANVGSNAGIVAGAAAGAAAGTLLPGVGNIIGAFAGGLFGSMGGQYVGRTIANYLEVSLDPTTEDKSKKETDPPEDKSKSNGVDHAPKL